MTLEEVNDSSSLESNYTFRQITFGLIYLASGEGERTKRYQNNGSELSPSSSSSSWTNGIPKTAKEMMICFYSSGDDVHWERSRGKRRLKDLEFSHEKNGMTTGSNVQKVKKGNERGRMREEIPKHSGRDRKAWCEKWWEVWVVQ